MSGMSRTIRVSSAVLLAVGGLGAGSAALAAVVPDAVTDVRIEEKTAQTWSQLKLTVDWKVPDGTKSGDTFTLELPETLSATDGARFPLNDAAGRTVANAVVAGRTVTFTMTDYAEKHVGVHGSAWFWVEFAKSVKPGDELDLTFRVGSTVYRDSISVGRPGPGNPDYPYKWQAWMKAAPDAQGDRILWAITGPAVSDKMVNSTYEITDLPGDGQRIDCSQIDVFSGRPNGSDPFTDATYVAPNRWNLECTPTKATVTIKPTAGEIGRAFRLLGKSKITLPNRTEYSNSGNVRLWGNVDLPVNSVIRAGGGGEGTGTTPSPTTTTTPGTPAPTPTVTVTVTAPPVPTVTVTATPAPTVTVTAPPTVTVPGTPPSNTVTVPGTTPSTTVTVPGSTPSTTVTLPGTTPTPTTTVSGGTPVMTITTVSGGQPVAPARPVVHAAQPKRIDTGVPQEGIDMRLAGVGGVFALGGGVGLIALSRRRPRTEDTSRAHDESRTARP